MTTALVEQQEISTAEFERKVQSTRRRSWAEMRRIDRELRALCSELAYHGEKLVVNEIWDALEILQTAMEKVDPREEGYLYGFEGYGKDSRPDGLRGQALINWMEGWAHGAADAKQKQQRQA